MDLDKKIVFYGLESLYLGLLLVWEPKKAFYWNFTLEDFTKSCVNVIQFFLESYSNNGTLYMEIYIRFCNHLKRNNTLDIHGNGTYFRKALQRKILFILRPVNLPCILRLPKRNKREHALIYTLRSKPTFLILLLVCTFLLKRGL